MVLEILFLRFRLMGFLGWGGGGLIKETWSRKWSETAEKIVGFNSKAEFENVVSEYPNAFSIAKEVITIFVETKLYLRCRLTP